MEERKEFGIESASYVGIDLAMEGSERQVHVETYYKKKDDGFYMWVSVLFVDGKSSGVFIDNGVISEEELQKLLETEDIIYRQEG